MNDKFTGDFKPVYTCPCMEQPQGTEARRKDAVAIASSAALAAVHGQLPSGLNYCTNGVVRLAASIAAQLFVGQGGWHNVKAGNNEHTPLTERDLDELFEYIRAEVLVVEGETESRELRDWANKQVKR